MQFEQVLSKIKVDKQYRIFYSLYNGKFLFATKLEKFYLRNVKECSCNNVFTALAEYIQYLNTQGFKVFYMPKKSEYILIDDKFTLDTINNL